MFYYFVIFLFLSIFLFLLFITIQFLLTIIIILIYFILFQKNYYNSITHDNLAKYGNYKIKNVYLIQKNINFLFLIFVRILNILLLCRHNDIINEVQENKPQHLKLLVEIQLSNKKTKFLIIEKDIDILIHDNVFFDKNYKITKISIIKNKYTIHNVLTNVQKKMKDNYFKWNLVTNNCQNFVKEIIYFIHKKKKIYHFQEKKFMKYKNYTVIYIFNFIIILIKNYCFVNLLYIFI
jgi:hypothetical protein